MFFMLKKFPKTLNGKLKRKRSIKIFQIRYSVQMITYKSEKTLIKNLNQLKSLIVYQRL